MVLTQDQQLYISRVSQQLGTEAIREVVPDFDHNNNIDLTVNQFQKVVDNVKHYLSIGAEYRELLQPYQEQIKSRLGRDLTDLTVADLERVTFMFPEINMPYVIKRFRLKPVDYPLQWTKQYEYGIQQSPHCANNQMYYVKFYELLTIDFDEIQLSDLTDRLQQFCQRMQSFLFAVYQTFNGYHAMLLSHAVPYNEPMAARLMSSLGGDSWYTVFSAKNGYRLRLNRKLRGGTREPFVAREITHIGTGKAHPHCIEMVKLYNQFLAQHENDIEKVVGDPCPFFNDNFYDTFIRNLIHNKFNNAADPDDSECRTSGAMLEHAKTRGVTRELIVEAAEGLLQALCKPQRLLSATGDYYVAVDQYTNTIYMCYRDLAMIDLDRHKTDTDIGDIYEYLDARLDRNSTAVEIYSSLHGYHLFLIDKPRDYSNIDNILELNRLGCDFYYSIYSYQRGYCVRLNRKNYRDDLDQHRNLYEYCGFFGNPDLIDPGLRRLCRIHYEIMFQYQNSFVNQIR